MIKLLVLTFLNSLLLLGCGEQSAQILDLHSELQDPSKLITVTRDNAAADGEETNTVLVMIKESHGWAVVGAHPTLVVGGGTATVVCGKADNKGFATCTLRSSVPGIRTLSFLDPNGVVGTNKVHFRDKTIQQPGFSVSSGGSSISRGRDISTGQVKMLVMSSIGEPISPVLQKRSGASVSDPVKVKSNLTGVHSK